MSGNLWMETQLKKHLGCHVVLISKTHNLGASRCVLGGILFHLTCGGTWDTHIRMSMLTSKCPVRNMDCTNTTWLLVCVLHSAETLSNLLSSPLSSINSKKKFIFFELLGEKYHPILSMGLLSKDNRDNCDCLGKPDFEQMVSCREI